MKIEYPRLILCHECGKHGFFALSADNRTNGFVTQENAHYIFDQIQEEEWVDINLVEDIKNQINSSKLFGSNHKPTAEDERFTMSVIWYDMTSAPDGEKPLPCQVEIYEEWPNVIGYP